MDAQPIPPDPPLKETLLRQCPHCLSMEVEPAGRVTATKGMILVDFRCGVCGGAFVLRH
jgi:hypothetical protein